MNLPSSGGPRATRGLLVAVFLQGSSILALEIVLSRILAVVMWHHFASLAISLALLGMTLGAVAIYLRPRLTAALPFAGIASGAGAALIFVFFWAAGGFPAFGQRFFGVFSHPFYEPYGPGGIGGQGALILHLLVLFVLLTLPFAAGGTFLAGALSGYGASSGALYAADLLGAGFGCYLSVGMLDSVDGFSALLLAALPAVASSCVLGPGPRLRRCAALVAATLGVTAALNANYLFSRYPFVRGRYQPDLLHEAWDATSRVAVYPSTGSQEEGSWGQSRRYKGVIPPQLGLVVDDSGFTTITSWPADGNLEFMRHNILALPYVLKESADTLIIGPGGGRDILAALAMQARKIEAVEINPLVVEAVDHVFGEFSGRIYSRQGVVTRVTEARSFLGRHRERHDVLQAALVYGRLPSSAGAFTLTEEHLYTRESFREYLDRLRDDGILSISRFVHEKRMLRLLVLGIEALRGNGASDPRRHFFIASERGLATLILKKSPLDESEVSRLEKWCRQMGFQVLYSPGGRSANNFSRLLESPSTDEFLSGYRFDVSSLTDDRPYFYYLLKPADFWRVMVAGGRYEFEDRAVILVRNALAVLGILTILAAVLPLSRSAARRSPAGVTLGALGYFGGIAVGFIIVEIVLLKSLILYLGYPVLSLTVVLAGLLFSAGAGSMVASRFGSGGNPTAAGAWVLLTAGMIALFPIWSRPLLQPVLTAPLSIRIGASMLVTLPLGVSMGACLPAGLAVLGRSDRALVPWAVGMNGAFSVLGAMAAVLMALNYGFRSTLLMGAGAYLAALGGLALMARKQFET